MPGKPYTPAEKRALAKKKISEKPMYKRAQALKAKKKAVERKATKKK